MKLILQLESVQEGLEVVECLIKQGIVEKGKISEKVEIVTNVWLE